MFSNTTFTYDGNSKRVKSVLTTNVGVTTTYFVGAHYEVSNGIITKYYYAGSTRIAMRKNGTLTYLFGDHLGSTSIVTDASGNLISQQKYKAWGETRYSSGSEVTDYQYTGQYSYESELGLYFYNARFYDPLLGRFNQPDIIIPENQGVQAWDRFAYTNNNPIRYTDPSGHCIGVINCIFQVLAATAFLAGRAVTNGGLEDQDFRDAADFAAPARASGSKESVSVFISEMVAGVASVSLVTTADGQSQVFVEKGFGAAMPGVGASITHGEVYGLEDSVDGDGNIIYDPLKYKGGATQGNVSIPILCDTACGPYFEGYISDDHQVWGIDVGFEIGASPTILGAAHTNAEDRDIITLGVPIDVSFLNRNLSGLELLGCRLLSMCGAR